MKIKNPQANPNSKTQKAKAEYAKKHPVKYVKCEKCDLTNTTLYNVDGKYYCKEHIPKK